MSVGGPSSESQGPADSANHAVGETRDRVMTITLSRPDRLNAFTPRMRDELLELLDEADRDDQVRAVIFTGAGAAFCAGADLGLGLEAFDYPQAPGDPGDLSHRERGGTLTLRLFDMKKPLIAAINGASIGIGVTMTLPMDFRIASADARFGLMFARRGLVPEAASSWFLPRLVGIAKALDWTLTGRVFDAAEALEARLVSKVVPAEELAAEAMALASLVSSSAPVSVAMTRQMLWKGMTVPHPMEAHRLETKAIRALAKTADAREGVSAFKEKRAAAFGGRPSQDMPDFYPWWNETVF